MEWKEVRLGDVCEIKHGFAYKGKYFSDTPTCDILVTPGNFTLSGGFKLDKPKFYNGPVEKDYILSKGDLIVTMTDLSKNIDTLGYSALVPEVKGFTFHHNQRIGLVENIANNVDKYFLYWIMRTPAYQSFIATHSSGTTVHHTSPKGIGNYVFKLPPLDDQRRIASILSSLDRKIELNNKINADLEEMAQAIFKNWFVDFEPFKDGKFVDSELGMIPEGWKVGRLEDIAEITMGQSPAGNSLNENREGMMFYQGSSDFGFRFPSIRVFTTEPKRLAVANSVLFSVRAPVGDINVAKEECCIGRGVASIKSKYGHDSYLFYTMKSLHKLFDSFDGEGTVFGSINKKTLSAIQILLPSEGIVEQFNDVTSSFDNRIRCLSEESSRLSLLRDTLLPRLMSGEIEVPD